MHITRHYGPEVCAWRQTSGGHWPVLIIHPIITHPISDNGSHSQRLVAQIASVTAFESGQCPLVVLIGYNTFPPGDIQYACNLPCVKPFPEQLLWRPFMQRNTSYHRKSHRSLYLDNPCAADGLQPLRPLSHLILTIKTGGMISRSARKVALAFCGRREGPTAVAPISKQSHLGEDLAMHLAHAVRHGGNEDILVGVEA